MTLRIDANLSFPHKNISNRRQGSMYNIYTKADSCEISFGRQENKTSILKKIFRKYDTTYSVQAQRTDLQVSDFSRDLSTSIKEATGKRIPPENLVSIMSPTEFREILPTLKSDNFLKTKANVANGVYCADLDYQSNFSSGKNCVYDILDRVAKQADEYVRIQKENGIPEDEIKPFYFALSDRDVIDGIQRAIIYIGSEPEKYKNIKFIPTIKLTYAHPADTSALGYENSDMLVYGINPFSENLTSYLDNIIEKRKEMILEFITEIYKLYPSLGYDIDEFSKQNEIKYLRSFAVSNLYWRVREYAEGKGDTIIKGLKMEPEAIMKSTSSIFRNLGNVNVGSQRDPLIDPFSSSITKDLEFNKTIKGTFTKYSTHFDEEKKKTTSAAENLYEDMIACLSKEKEKPVLALSAPIYLAHYFEQKESKTFENVVKYINTIIEASNGMLCAFESITPQYGIDSGLNSKKIKLFNNYIRNNTTLYEVGGSFDGVMTS